MPDAANVRARLQAQIHAMEASGVKPDVSGFSDVSDTSNISGASDAPDASQTAQEEEARTFAKIQRLAAVREQSSEGLRRRLVREGFDEGAVDSALARAQRCGIIDDERFAEALMRSRRAAGRGMRGIEAELSDLGIDPALAYVDGEEAPSEDAEIERALSLLRRRPPTAKNKRDAAYRRLMQKGYGSSVASSAARLWSESL